MPAQLQCLCSGHRGSLGMPVNESGNLIPGPPLIFWFAFQKKPEGMETIKASMHMHVIYSAYK